MLIQVLARMHHRFAIMVWLLGSAVLLGACSSAPQVNRIDFTQSAGLFLVVYSAEGALRQGMEDQLAADLAAREMIGFPSHADLPNIGEVATATVIDAALRRRAAGVLVVNRVTPAGTERVVRNPARVSPEHPDLQAFFAYARGQANPTVEPAGEAIVEVNLFLLQDGDAQLFWSGAAMTTAVDGKGSGLRDLSGQIADALERAQRQLRGQ